MRFQNPANAFIRLESGSNVILIDPWLSEGLYRGGWYHHPTLANRTKIIEGATHLLITHIHEDHFDLGAIAKLPREIQILLPRVFPNHVMEMKLKKIGFENIKFVEKDDSVSIDDLEISIVPPMNAFGQQDALYKENPNVAYAIDSGFIIENTEKEKLVFLADNSPYGYESLSPYVKDKLAGCDLLAFPYNGAASDYPLCYDNLSKSEKIQISLDREEKRKDATYEFIRAFQPKALMPYSSDFFVGGPRAKEFKIFENEWWANKVEVAKRYEADLKIPSYTMFEGDVLDLKDGEILIEKNSDADLSFENVEKRVFSERPPIVDMFPDIKSRSARAEDVEAAQKNMFATMERYRLRSDWIFKIVLSDQPDESYTIDFRTAKLYRGDDRFQLEDRKVLQCQIHAGYFEAILQGKCHWNNAQLTFQLSWSRIPNEFDHGLYAAINFFHVPRGRQ